MVSLEYMLVGINCQAKKGNYSESCPKYVGTKRSQQKQVFSKYPVSKHSSRSFQIGYMVTFVPGLYVART